MPEVYESANEYITEQATEVIRVEEERRKEFLDPIREFEHSMADVEGSLRNWLSLDLETKQRLVRQYASMMASGAKTHRNETDAERETRLRVAWRCLNVIIQEESRDPDGIREIALMALNGLFPQPMQAPPKKAS